MFELNLMLADEPASDCPLDMASLKFHCHQALERQQRVDTADVDLIEVSVQMLGTASMQALNHQYRDKDSATNVLSFESGLPVLADSDERQLLALGDLVFCPDVIASEASVQGKSEAWHWAHMIVHGTLHLCGYDHIQPTDASEMENLEIRILSDSGISNPYQIQPVK